MKNTYPKPRIVQMKLWLTGMTNANNGDHLKELIEPIKEYFDGLVWVYHTDQENLQAGQRLEEGLQYLYNNKKQGKILRAPWCNRTDFSRNIGLYHGPIKYGDWFMTIDTLERMHVDFAAMLPNLIKRFDDNGIDGVFLRNKHFLFKYNERSAYQLNPHSGMAGISKSFEITTMPFWKDEYWQNVRHLHRDKYEFIDHNLKYYLFPNTNHLVLKCEHDQKFIQFRYQVRAAFFNEMQKLNIDIQDFKAVKDFLIAGEYNDTIKACIEKEKYLNDFYKFYVDGNKDIEEDFDFENLVKVK